MALPNTPQSEVEVKGKLRSVHSFDQHAFLLGLVLTEGLNSLHCSAGGSSCTGVIPAGPGCVLALTQDTAGTCAGTGAGIMLGGLDMTPGSYQWVPMGVPGLTPAPLQGGLCLTRRCPGIDSGITPFQQSLRLPPRLHPGAHRLNPPGDWASPVLPDPASGPVAPTGAGCGGPGTSGPVCGARGQGEGQSRVPEPGLGGAAYGSAVGSPG